MPRGDRTGPMGAGPRSGRRAGFCSGFDRPGYANAEIPGGAPMEMAFRQRGWSGGPAAGGRGWRHRCFATGRPGGMSFGAYPAPVQPLNPASEKASLKNRSRALQSELDAIKKRLEEIEPQEE